MTRRSSPKVAARPYLIRSGRRPYGISIVGPEEIDTLNILHASMAAMARAHKGLIEAHPDLAQALVLVDGIEGHRSRPSGTANNC